MPGALDKLAKWFDRKSIHYQRDNTNGHLLTTFSHPDGKLDLVIEEIGNNMVLLQVVALEIVSAGDERHLLDLASRFHMLELVYQPADRELRAKVQLPVSDEELEDIVVDQALRVLLPYAALARSALRLTREGLATEEALERAMADTIEEVKATRTKEVNLLLSLPWEAQSLLREIVDVDEENDLAFYQENLDRFTDSVLTAFNRVMGRVGSPWGGVLWRILKAVWTLRRWRELESLPHDIDQLLQTLGKLQMREDLAGARITVDASQELLKHLKSTTTPILLSDVQAIQGSAHRAIYRLTSVSDEARWADIAYRRALEIQTWEVAPAEWAQTQGNLGSLLSTRYERTGEEHYAEEAERIFRRVLDVCTREVAPTTWAQTQSNLGNLLLMRYQQAGGGQYVQEAEEAFRGAMEVQTREDAPSDWATMQNNLGSLLQRLYLQTGEEHHAEEAEKAYRGALEIQTREDAPSDWAQTQGNLGSLLSTRYDRTGEEHHAEEAEKAYRGALEIQTREDAPSDWGRTQHNLGNLLFTRYERTGEEQYADEAEGIYQRALDARTRDDDPVDWAQTQCSLGGLLSTRYERTGEEHYAQESEEALRRAMEIQTREDAPSDWATMQNNLGNLLSTRYERTGEEHYAQESEEALRRAIEAQMWEVAPSDRIYMQGNLGNLLSARYTRTGEERYADEAEQSYREALEARAREVAPSIWASIQNNLGNLLSAKYERTGEEQYADEAEQSYREALRIINPLIAAANALQSQHGLARLLTRGKHWVQADTAYEDAVSTAEHQYLSAPSDAARRRLMVRHVTLYHEHAYCLLSLGEPLRALARLDEGRARGLGETLGLDGEARAAHGEQGVARLRTLRRGLRSAEGLVEAAETRLRTSAPGPARNKATDERDKASAGLRAAYDKLRAEIHNLDLEPPILAPSDLTGLPLLPSIAVIAFLPGSDAHAFVLYEGIVLPVALPDFSEEDIRKLVSAMPPQVHRWVGAYNARIAARRLRMITDMGEDSSTTEATLEEAEQTWRRALDEIAATQGNYDAGWYIGYQLAFYILERDHHPAATRAAMQAWKGIVARTVDAVWERFWKPVRAVLPEEVTEVLLLVGGEAALLPLHAAAGELTVGYAPSMGVWLRCMEAAVGREPTSLLVATPAPPEDLSFTPAEAEWLTHLFAELGNSKPFLEPLHLNQAEATVQAVLRASTDRSVIHFSGHATYNWSKPLRSGLQCHDGILTLAQARQEMDLQTGRLVVLSACSTGISDVFGSGEEWVGLPAGLLEAGAPAVMASLWPVNDLSTAFLMDRFYTLWLDRKAERTISAALREAAEWLRSASWSDLMERVASSQLSDEFRALLNELLKKMQLASTTKMLHSAGDFIIEMARANPDEKPFAAPYYWAAFAVYGAVL
jgi:hypothetical protein